MDLPQSVTPSASQVAAPAVARARARSGVAASLAQKATTQKRVQKKQARWPAGKFNRVRFPSFPGLPAVRYFPFSGPIFRTAARRAAKMTSTKSRRSLGRSQPREGNWIMRRGDAPRGQDNTRASLISPPRSVEYQRRSWLVPSRSVSPPPRCAPWLTPGAPPPSGPRRRGPIAVPSPSRARESPRALGASSA